MSLQERYDDIARAIDHIGGDVNWANAVKALVKQLIRNEVPYGGNFMLEPRK